MTGLQGLLSVSLEERDTAWEQHFLEALPAARFNVVQDELLDGPDGFPYLLVETAEEGSESFEQIVEWTFKTGSGIAVNPMQSAPDFVFNFGMIWNFLKFGTFVSDAEKKFEGSFQLTPGDKIEVGDPSDEYFPMHARKLLREFLVQQGFDAPKLSVIKTKNGTVDICFSLESLAGIPASDRNNFLQAIGWFFPAHYSLALISESGLPPFYPL